MRPSTTLTRVSVLLPIFVGFTIAPTHAQNGYVGVFADSAGTEPCATVPPWTIATLYVVAKPGGESALGITGAEFRIEVSNPSGWLFFFTAPNGSSSLGNPIDTDASPSDHSGINIAFSSCRQPVNGNVQLGTISIFNIGGSPTQLLVKRHNTPSNPTSSCPLFVLCDATFSVACMSSSGTGPCALSPQLKVTSVVTSVDPPVFYGAALPGIQSGARPWTGLIDRPIASIFMQKDLEEPSLLHEGLDFTSKFGSYSVALTPMDDNAKICNCNDTADDPGLRYIMFQSGGNSGLYYLYTQGVEQGSIFTNTLKTCEELRTDFLANQGYTASTSDHIAGWTQGMPPFHIHIETSDAVPIWPLGSSTYEDSLDNPLLHFSAPLDGHDNNPPHITPVSWPQGPLVAGTAYTVTFRAYDKTWNNGTFVYDTSAGDEADGYRTGIYRAEVCDLTIGSCVGHWELDYYRQFTPSTLMNSCVGATAECEYKLVFRARGPAGLHTFELSAADYNGNEASAPLYTTGNNRWISNVQATGNGDHVTISWFAQSFDLDETFQVWRSNDGGVTFPTCVQSGGSCATVVFTDNQQYSLNDYGVTNNFNYCYRIYDSEGGDWWYMSYPFTGSLSSLPAAPSPAGTPNLVIDALWTDGSTAIATIRLTQGATWAFRYNASVYTDQNPTPITVSISRSPTANLGENPPPYLYPFRNYHLTLQAVGMSANGATSSQKNFRAMPGPNLYHAAIVGGTAISMAWTGVYWINTSYIVQYQIINQPWSLISINVGSQRVYQIAGLQPNADYSVQVCALDEWSNLSPPSNFVALTTTTSQPTDVITTLPAKLDLSVTPNPIVTAVSAARIDLAIPRSGPVDLSVVDVRGRLVKQIFKGTLEAGSRALSWNAADAAGNAVASGVYFAIVRAPGVAPEERIAKIVVRR